MKINVHKLRHLHGKKLPLEESYQLPRLLERNRQILDIGHVNFQGFGEMSGSIFIVKGVLSGTLLLACSRCLAETKHTFHENVEERFNIDPSQSFENNEEEEEIHQVENNVIDLLPIIEEEVLLSIPIIPTCLGECTNEIPTAGTGWSLIEEEEEKNKVDPRLADLQKFFKKK